LDVWFRSGLREMARERLLDRSALVGTILDHGIVERLLDDHERGRRNEDKRIWALLSLEVWNTVFVARQGSRSLPHPTSPALAGTADGTVGHSAPHRPAGGAG
jgi:asparagine synthase (glutamine-hydrolysing)